MGIQVSYHKDELKKITTGTITTNVVEEYDIDNQTSFKQTLMHYTNNHGDECFLGHLEENESCWFDNKNVNMDSVEVLEQFGVKYTRA